jgi:predicted  nucleic acid-binding Zn-ribbon protein
MQLDDLVEGLLKEFKAQRDQIKDMVDEVEGLRQQVGQLFPEALDARTRRFLEDKVKAMVAFYNVLLDMRKEISKSIKDELDVRRRLDTDDFDPEDVDSLLDIRELSKKVEKFTDDKHRLQRTRLDKHKGIEELEEKGIEVPGLNELKELEE